LADANNADQPLGNAGLNEAFPLEQNDDQNAKIPIGLLPSINNIPQLKVAHPEGRPTGFSDAVCNFNTHM
jgi:hypothetical protein